MTCMCQCGGISDVQFLVAHGAIATDATMICVLIASRQAQASQHSKVTTSSSQAKAKPPPPVLQLQPDGVSHSPPTLGGPAGPVSGQAISCRTSDPQVYDHSDGAASNTKLSERAAALGMAIALRLYSRLFSTGFHEMAGIYNPRHELEVAVGNRNP